MKSRCDVFFEPDIINHRQTGLRFTSEKLHGNLALFALPMNPIPIVTSSSANVHNARSDE